jgi:hypothetical protein
MSDGTGSAGICGIFRPMIPLTDLSDLDGDALVGDPCPEHHKDVDATLFLRAGFKFGFALATATGVGIRLLSRTFGNLGRDVGGVEAVVAGPICGRGRAGGVEGYGWCREGDGKGSCEFRCNGAWGKIIGGCAGLLGEFVILSMVSRRDGTNCASTRGKSANWLLRFEDDLLLVPAFESRLFRKDIRETRLGSVEDADDEVGSCDVGTGAGTNESSGSARDRSAVVARRISASADLSSSGCGCVRPAAAA